LPQGTAAAALASTAAAAGAPAAEVNPWAPTELGLDIIRFMSQTYGAVLYEDCHVVDAEWAPDFDAAKLADVRRASRETDARRDRLCAAITERPVTLPAHLTDLAIAFCAREIEDDLLQLEDGSAPVDLIIATILTMAGVEIPRPWGQALYEQIEAAKGQEPV
jgi:hypothetical protein